MSKIINHSNDLSLPYSTVLEIKGNSLIVICGQVAEDEYDNIVGSSIQEQSIQTLNNCKIQLAHAGCELKDVFKVNIYIRNIEDWAEFNNVFVDFFPSNPKPVRTTVQTGLLSNFLIEIEMWAVK